MEGASGLVERGSSVIAGWTLGLLPGLFWCGLMSM